MNYSSCAVIKWITITVSQEFAVLIILCQTLIDLLFHLDDRLIVNASQNLAYIETEFVKKYKVIQSVRVVKLSIEFRKKDSVEHLIWWCNLMTDADINEVCQMWMLALLCMLNYKMCFSRVFSLDKSVQVHLITNTSMKYSMITDTVCCTCVVKWSNQHLKVMSIKTSQIFKLLNLFRTKSSTDLQRMI